MSEAAMMESVVTNDDSMAADANKPLRNCVEDAMENYFQQLEGEVTNELYKMVLAEIEEPLFRSVLKYTAGNQSKASELLGINRGTLRKKLKMYGLHG